MRARVGSIDVEGSPEEIAALIRAMDGRAPTVQTDDDPTSTTSGRRFVSEEIAFRVLRRRELKPAHHVVLQILARQSPEWTTAKELQRALKYDASQFAGFLGAFGKRLTATDGYKPGTWFFDQEWDYEAGCNRYRLSAEVCAAVTRALS